MPGHLSTRQYARLADRWVSAIGPRREEYAMHSLRLTKIETPPVAQTMKQNHSILLQEFGLRFLQRWLGVGMAAIG